MSFFKLKKHEVSLWESYSNFSPNSLQFCLKKFQAILTTNKKTATKSSMKYFSPEIAEKYIFNSKIISKLLKNASKL